MLHITYTGFFISMNNLSSMSVSITVQEILYYGFKGNVVEDPMNCDVIFAPGRSLVKAIIEASDLLLTREVRRKHFFAVTDVALANTIRWRLVQRTPVSVHNDRRQWYIKIHQQMMETLKAGPLGKSLDVTSLRIFVDGIIDSQNKDMAHYGGVAPEELCKLKEAKSFVEVKTEIVIPEDAV